MKDQVREELGKRDDDYKKMMDDVKNACYNKNVSSFAGDFTKTNLEIGRIAFEQKVVDIMEGRMPPSA